MDLEIQIQSLIVSYIYGLFFSLTYNLLFFILYHNNKYLRILFDLLYIFILFTLYFYILLVINKGIVHIYFVILLVLGFITGNYKTKKIRVEMKKSK